MKRLILVTLMLMFVSFTFVFAADTSNVVVTPLETNYSVMYYGVATMGVAGGEDNCTTQWMRCDFIDFTNNPGTLQIWCTDITGTENINGYIQFSNSTTATTFKELATDGGLDAIATTVLWDTVGVAMGVKTYGATYMRLKLDGQTSSPHSVEVNWYMLFAKPPTHYGKYKIANVGDTL